MENQKHREPILYIVGNPERKDEIRHIIEEEWGGVNIFKYKYDYKNSAHFINPYGIVSQESLHDEYFVEAVKKGWMKEYKLPEKVKFKPFDRVVTSPKNGKSLWTVNYYSHNDGEYTVFVGGSMVITKNHIILPYNEQTENLIGTNDEWKGGNNEK